MKCFRSYVRKINCTYTLKWVIPFVYDQHCLMLDFLTLYSFSVMRKVFSKICLKIQMEKGFF